MSCCAPGCKTGYGTKGTYPPGVGSHHIPKDPVMRQKWIEAIPRANWKPSKHSKLCSLHFDEDDYLTERRDTNPHRSRKGPLKVRRLKPTAVPHIFPGVPPMIFVKKEGASSSGEDKENENTKEPSKTPTKPIVPSIRRRKELKEGEFDLNSIMPWKLDFNATDKEATFWLWEQKWRTFYNFLNLNNHDDDFKMSTFRSYLSDGVISFLDGLKLPAHQATDVEYMLTVLRINAAKQSNVVQSRMNFNLRHQEENEVFDSFLVDLLTLSKSCEFCEGCRDNLIRDRILVGLNNSETITKLLSSSELTLQQTINICRKDEKDKMFSYRDYNEDDHDPYFDGDPFQPDKDPDYPEIQKQRQKNRSVRQSIVVRAESVLSDLDDHTYSAAANAVAEARTYYEDIDDDNNETQGFEDSNMSTGNGGTAIVSVSGDQVIITMNDGDSIQNVLDLNDLDADLVDLQEGPVIVKTEAIEQPVVVIEPDQPQVEVHEMRKGKRPFKPKQTFEEYLAELGLENFGIREKFLCHMCPMEFSTSARMLYHIKNVHERDEDPQPKKVTGGKCKFCSEEFTLMKHLKKHISEVHKEYKPFSCKLCPAKFYQGGHLRRHIRILHENERRFACDMCSKRFGERDGLVKHKAYVHLEQKCDDCLETFINGKELRNHINACHPQDKPHLCEGCGKSFANQAILNNHVSRVHTGDLSEKNHACQACGSRFRHYHFLLYHIKKMRMNKCPLHVRLAESNDFGDLPDYEVEAIQQEARKASYEGFPPRCKLCNITFTAVPTLRNHLATVHAKEKNHECGVCQKRFKTSKILAQHTQSVHLGMKPYDCPHCPAKFGQQAHRMRHVRVVHEGLKEHVCDTCGKRYANKIDLHNHLKKIHDQGVTFDCPHCGNKYEKKKELLAHLEQVHEAELT